MKHFLAYHNVDRMGRQLHEGDPLAVITNTPVKRLFGHVVWFVVGEGSSDGKRYSLGSVFVVSETGDTNEGHFKHYARGQGHVFRPPIPLNNVDWFPDMLRQAAHFSFGVKEVTDERLVSELLQLAANFGCDTAPLQDHGPPTTDL